VSFLSKQPGGSVAKADSWKMFNAISARYDLLNHLLSFGLHIRWRKHLAIALPPRPGLRVLDLATGTADVLLALSRHNPRVRRGVGLDLAENMLAVGRQKIQKQGLTDRLELRRADAMDLPFKDPCFDAVTMAFGIRNVPSPQKVLSEAFRVLRPGGRILVLEFSFPENAFWKQLDLFYLRTVVPLIGGLLTGHYQAYKYLNETIEAFPYGGAFLSLLGKAGFVSLQARPLLLGVATIYQGDRPAS